MADQRIVFYSASFFKIHGVTLTLRGLISHITNEGGGQVLVLTADNPSDSTTHDFTRSCGALVSVMRVAGGPVPAPGADYALELRVPTAIKEALEAYCPTAVHITNPYLVVLWTEFMKRKVEGEGWDTQLGVWGRGIEPDLFSTSLRCQVLRRRPGLGPNDTAALWLARVVKRTNPGVWLQAVKQVQREALEKYEAAVTDAAGRNQDHEGAPPAPLLPRVVGICVGEGEAMSTLKGVDGVVCVGWKAGEELTKVVASCDIMVAPREIETFGRITLEAMSCGLPCVVNKECGAHLVKTALTGIAYLLEINPATWRG
eukprot:g14192.t1